MFLFLLTVVIAALLLFLLVKWRKMKNYWANKGVPHMAPHPILGSLTFLQRQNPALWMRQLYEDFKTPYVGIWLFWRPGLVINSPEIAKRILVKDQEIFRNRFLSSGKTDPIGALNIFTVNDPTWSAVRRRLTSVFTAAKLRSLNHITTSKANNLIPRIDKEMASDEPVDLRKLCTDYTTDVIGESAFGIATDTLIKGDSIMRKVTREFQAFNLHRGLSWCSIFFFPELVDFFKFSFFPKDTVDHLRHILRKIIEQRGGYDKKITDVKDLLDALLKIKQEASIDGDEITEDLLLAQAAIFLLGGFDTSSATLCYIFYYLAWYPECQEKLYNEMCELKEKIGDRDFNSTDLGEATYVDCVIKETLRVFPPMGWLDRIATNDYKIDDNLTIAAGTVVYINSVSTQVDPQYFPDPWNFDPDRFLPENEKDIVPYSFTPFGEGPRSCIGMRFGYQTIRQAMATIIMNYEIQKLPKCPRPVDLKVETRGLFLMPGEKMSVNFIRRQK